MNIHMTRGNHPDATPEQAERLDAFMVEYLEEHGYTPVWGGQSDEPDHDAIRNAAYEAALERLNP